jgi:hypothetical protein
VRKFVLPDTDHVSVTAIREHSASAKSMRAERSYKRRLPKRRSK